MLLPATPPIPCLGVPITFSWEAAKPQANSRSARGIRLPPMTTFARPHRSFDQHEHGTRVGGQNRCFPLGFPLARKLTLKKGTHGLEVLVHSFQPWFSANSSQPRPIKEPFALGEGHWLWQARREFQGAEQSDGIWLPETGHSHGSKRLCVGLGPIRPGVLLLIATAQPLLIWCLENGPVSQHVHLLVSTRFWQLL